jgi:hypothetical protein
MKYLLSIPVLILLSILFPVAYVARWIANKLMTITIKTVECLPNIDS